MARVEDVAAFVLEQAGTMTTFKLQKLLYYAQGWSLAWDAKPLFEAKIKAYENGPVVSTLYAEHKGQRYVSRWPSGDSAQLDESEKETIRGVLEMYGSKTPQELVTMTHDEAPWRDAWVDKSMSAREIRIDAIRAFFTAEAERKATAKPSPTAAAMAGRLRSFLDRGDT